MFKRKILKFVVAFKSLTPTSQGLILLGILLIIGIIIRWDYIISEVIRGFGFYSGK